MRGLDERTMIRRLPSKRTTKPEDCECEGRGLPEEDCQGRGLPSERTAKEEDCQARGLQMRRKKTAKTAREPPSVNAKDGY